MSSEPETKPSGVGPELLIVAGLALLLVLVLVVWGRGKANVGGQGNPGRPARAIADQLAGDHACAECHPGEAALHARSGHSRTLHPIAQSAIAKSLEGRSCPDPDFPGVIWTYHFRDDRFTIERSEGDTAESFGVDYAFGSGSHATTFVKAEQAPPSGTAAFEHRLTWFANGDRLGVTPGQDEGLGTSGRGRSGRHWGEAETLQCFGCHSTLTSAEGKSRLDLATMIPNISCESCHGPGRDHIAAARKAAPSAELAMDYGPGRYKSEDQMRLCGQCHRHPDMAPPGSIRPENAEIVRFQPVGLMQSACYKGSRGAMNCATCHDPHSPASRNPASYDRACRKCHQGEEKRTCPSPGASSGNCAGCHMPKQDSGQGIRFADHWIRVP